MRWLHPNSSCSISQASVNHSDTDQEHRAWAGLLISQPVQAECSSVSFSISNTIVPLACLLLDYLPDRQEEFGLSGGLQFDTVLLFPSGHQEWQEKEESPELGGTRMPDRDSYANGTGSSSGGPGGGGSEEASGTGAGSGGASSDAICRDFLRNVCKRGKRCRYRHPDMSEVSNLGVSKNEFIFCHDFQNKECSRPNCRFIHGSKEDEDGYKKTGELPPRLRQKVAAGLGLSPADLPNGKEEVPICRDFLKGDCQRGAKCKFRHLL